MISQVEDSFDVPGDNQSHKEIERRFLISSIPQNIEEVLTCFERIDQGYLSLDVEHVVRVRTVQTSVNTKTGFITIKAPGNGFERNEFEYEIPHLDAKKLLEKCYKPLISKFRHHWQGFEIDVFQNEFDDLIIAERELKSMDETFDIPAWFGREITTDYNYTNLNLAKEYRRSHESCCISG